MKGKITLACILILLLCGFSTRNQTLYYAATHFPPWDINTDGKDASGINADIIHAIAEKLGADFRPVRCPWKRCLQLLEAGEIDMAGTVGRTPEREAFLQFIEPPYAKVPDQVFYLLENSKLEIRTYEDLYQLKKIGVELGARVYQRFDQDTRLSKEEVPTLERLLLMLEHERVDTFIGNEMVTDYMIKEMGMRGKFKKAPFRFSLEGNEYLAISKKSPHLKRLDEIGRAVSEMRENGQIQSYIENYTK